MSLKAELAKARMELEEIKHGRRLKRMTQMRAVPELKQLELPLAV